MGRYVPKTYYNRRLLRIVTRAVISVALAGLVLFIALFFFFQQYKVPNPDGTLRLEIPWLMDETEPQVRDGTSNS